MKISTDISNLVHVYSHTCLTYLYRNIRCCSSRQICRCVNTNQVSPLRSIKKERNEREREEREKERKTDPFLVLIGWQLQFDIFQLVREDFFLLLILSTNYLVHNLLLLLLFSSITYTSNFSWRRQRRRWSNFKHISKKIFDPIISRIRQWRVCVRGAFVIKTSPTRVDVGAAMLARIIIERQWTGVCASFENQLPFGKWEKMHLPSFSLSLSLLFGRNLIQFKYTRERERTDKFSSRDKCHEKTSTFSSSYVC